MFLSRVSHAAAALDLTTFVARVNKYFRVSNFGSQEVLMGIFTHYCVSIIEGNPRPLIAIRNPNLPFFDCENIKLFECALGSGARCPKTWGWVTSGNPSAGCMGMPGVLFPDDFPRNHRVQAEIDLGGLHP